MFAIRRSSSTRVGLLTAFFVVSAVCALPAQRLRKFDVPEATYTHPTDINPSGQIVGDFAGPDGVHHGFLRHAGGAIVTFDVPESSFTYATAIGYGGEIVGYSNGPILQWGPDQLSYELYRAFLRKADGTIELFDPCTLFGGSDFPRADYAYPQDIDASGTIVGLCESIVDVDIYMYGFLRHPDGSVLMVTGPNGPSQVGHTSPKAINARRLTTGSYLAGGGPELGFLLKRNGSYVTFTADDSVDALDRITSTEPKAMDAAGRITGTFVDSARNINEAFLRLHDGTITRFSVEGATATVPQGIGDDGRIVGAYADSNFRYHGFMRAPEGGLKTFDVPHSTNTYPTATSPGQKITGWYSDKNGVHGFVRHHEQCGEHDDTRE